jgi:hypothetical protein
MAYKNLEAFLTEVLTDPEGRKCTSLTCQYENPQGGLKEVLSIPIEGKTHEVAILYRMFKTRAESFVQDKPGMHTFLMSAYFDRRETPDNTQTFMVSDGEIRNGGASRVVNEHPNNQGLLAQLMRHSESQMGMNIDLVKTMASTWMQERSVLNKELADARAEVNDSYAIVREVMLTANSEQHQRNMEELKFKRTSEERNVMMKMAPTLINTLTGKEVFPSHVADTNLIDAIAERISMEQIDMLVGSGMIDAALADPLKMRFAQSKDKKARELEEAKRIPAGDTGNVTSITRAYRENK